MPTRTRRAKLPFAQCAGVVLVGLVAGLVGSVSCKSTIANTDHCYYNGGNDTCADRYGDDLPYCATVCAGKDGNAASPNDDGCVDWQPDEGCYSPCGGENDVADDASCLGVADTSSASTTMTTMTTMTTTVEPTSDTSDTTPAGCASSDDCMDLGAPICVDDECRPCEDAALPDGECGLRDEEFPVCGPSGACVQCNEDDASVCADATPVCGDDGMCRGCIVHSECDAACDMSTGACFPDSCDRTVPGDSTSVQAALDVSAGQEYCVIRIANHSGDSFVVDGMVKRAIISDSGTQWRLSGELEPTLRAEGGALVYVSRLQLRDNVAGAVETVGNGSMVVLDGVQILDNPGTAVRVLSGSHVEMRNSIVGGNGNGGDTPAVRVFDSSADILYSTIVDNDAVDADSIECNVSSEVTIRNSIVMSTDGQSIDCGADITFSALDENAGGSGNEDLSPLELTWFINAAVSNFHLTEAGDGALGGIARWIAGDPLVDLDDDARVAVDGESEAAGADVRE